MVYKLFANTKIPVKKLADIGGTAFLILQTNVSVHTESLLTAGVSLGIPPLCPSRSSSYLP